jgi:hypothetical protein
LCVESSSIPQWKSKQNGYIKPHSWTDDHAAISGLDLYGNHIYIYNWINPSCTVAQVMPFLGKTRFSTCLHIMCLLWDARSKPLLTVQLSLLLQLFRYTLSVFLCKWTQAWGRSSAAKSRYGFGIDMHGSMKKNNNSIAV